MLQKMGQVGKKIELRGFTNKIKARISFKTLIKLNLTFVICILQNVLLSYYNFMTLLSEIIPNLQERKGYQGKGHDIIRLGRNVWQGKEGMTARIVKKG